MTSIDTPRCTYAQGNVLRLHVLTSNFEAKTRSSGSETSSSDPSVESCMEGVVRENDKTNILAGSANVVPAVDAEIRQFADLNISTPPSTPPTQNLDPDLVSAFQNMLLARIIEAPSDRTFGVQNLPLSTKSVVMKVVVDGHSSPVILKLFDSRFCSRTGNTELPSPEISGDGFVGDNIEPINSNTGSIYDPSSAQETCHEDYSLESAVYNTLSRLQGDRIPKLLAKVVFQPNIEADLETQHQTAIHGILLSCADGFPFQELHLHIPRNRWRGAVNEAITGVESCARLGVLLQDARPQNFLVRSCTAIEGVRRVKRWMFIADLSTARLRYVHENDDEWEAKVNDITDEFLTRAVVILDDVMHDGFDDSDDEESVTEQEETLDGDEDASQVSATEHMELNVQRDPLLMGRRYPRAFLVDTSDDLDSDGEMWDEEMMDDEIMRPYEHWDWFNQSTPLSG